MPPDRPQVADVRAGVLRALVEANRGDEAADVGREIGAEFDSAGIVVRRAPRSLTRGPDASTDSLTVAPPTTNVTPRRRLLEVAAVVDGPAEDGDGACAAGRPRKRPVRSAVRALPREPPSTETSTPRDDAAAGVGGRSRNRDRRVRRNAAPLAGEVIVEVGATVSVDCTATTRPDCNRQRLHAHVGEEIHRRLLHRGCLARRCRGRDCCRAPTTTARCRRRRRARRSGGDTASTRGSPCQGA